MENPKKQNHRSPKKINSHKQVKGKDILNLEVKQSRMPNTKLSE